MTDNPLSTPIVASLELLVARALQGHLGAEFVAGLEELRGEWPDAYGSYVTAIAWADDAVVIAQIDGDAMIAIDDDAEIAMTRVPDTRFQIHPIRVEPGRTHNFGIRVGEQRVGRSICPHSLCGYGPLSHPMPGVPGGVLSPRRTLTSEVYDGAEVEYRTYVNHGADTERGAPLMIWLDGFDFVGRLDATRGRLQTVTDNLAHLGRIPPMVHLLLYPATGGRREIPVSSYHTRFADLRIMQYDEVSDEFVRHLLGEVLPEVSRDVKIREDAYSRAIFGASSGGCCAMKVGWYAPEAIGRIYSYIASFTAWGWRPDDGIDGGFVLPLWFRGEPKKNLRVYLSAGTWDDFDVAMPEHLRVNSATEIDDALHRAGSQALGQFEMAQALKTSGYDYRFRYGPTGHNHAQLGAELPDALTWLWRDYDPEKTSDEFEQDAEERARPAYRFGILNREP